MTRTISLLQQISCFWANKMTTLCGTEVFVRGAHHGWRYFCQFLIRIHSDTNWCCRFLLFSVRPIKHDDSWKRHNENQRKDVISCFEEEHTKICTLTHRERNHLPVCHHDGYMYVSVKWWAPRHKNVWTSIMSAEWPDYISIWRLGSGWKEWSHMCRDQPLQCAPSGQAGAKPQTDFFFQVLTCKTRNLQSTPQCFPNNVNAFCSFEESLKRRPMKKYNVNEEKWRSFTKSEHCWVSWHTWMVLWVLLRTNPAWSAAHRPLWSLARTVAGTKSWRVSEVPRDLSTQRSLQSNPSRWHWSTDAKMQFLQGGDVECGGLFFTCPEPLTSPKSCCTASTTTNLNWVAVRKMVPSNSLENRVHLCVYTVHKQLQEETQEQCELVGRNSYM